MRLCGVKKYFATVKYPNGHNFCVELCAESKGDAILKIRKEYKDECSDPKITIIRYEKVSNDS